MRILAITCLVLAFAQPYTPSKESNQSKNIVLFVDNSASMLAIDKNGENFNYAKLQAKEIIKSYGANANFKLVTHSQLSKHNLWLSGSEANEEIDQLNIADNSHSLSILLQQMDKLEIDRTFLISDFQESNIDLQKIDSSLSTGFIPVPTKGINQNVSVDSVWRVSPISLNGFEQTIFAQIKNHSQKAITNTSVSLSVNNSLAGAFTVDVPSNSSKVIKFNYTPTKTGVLKGVIEIVGPELRFDDSYLFSLKISKQRSVVVINETVSSPILSKVFQDKFVSFSEVNSKSIDLEKIQNADLIILDELTEISPALIDQLSNSTFGNVLIIPSLKANFSSYKALSNQFNLPSLISLVSLPTYISDINFQDPYFISAFSKAPKEVNIKGVAKHFNLTSSNNSYSLVSLNNKSPLAVRSEINERNIVLLTSGLSKDFGGWHQSNLIYPLLYQSVLFKTDDVVISYNTNDLGSYLVKRDIANSGPVSVLAKDATFIPRQESTGRQVKIALDDQFRTKGYYTVVDKKDTLGILALNIPKMESFIDFLSEEDITPFNKWTWFNSDLESIRNDISNLINGITYWKQCLLLALLFLLFEILLLRFWKSN